MMQLGMRSGLVAARCQVSRTGLLVADLHVAGQVDPEAAQDDVVDGDGAQVEPERTRVGRMTCRATQAAVSASTPVRNTNAIAVVGDKCQRPRRRPRKQRDRGGAWQGRAS